MGTRRASSSPARTELVKAVRTRDTAAAASGPRCWRIADSRNAREAPGRRGRPLGRIQVRDDGGKAGPRAHGDRGDLVAVEDWHEPQLERAVEIRVAEGSLYRLFALRGSGHVRLAKMALALRALHRVHHVRDLLHGAHDAGGGSRSGRASTTLSTRSLMALPAAVPMPATAPATPPTTVPTAPPIAPRASPKMLPNLLTKSERGR